jgi:hypothetical protein
MPDRTTRPDEQPAALLRGVIDQIDEGIATILFDDERRVEWPISRLPANVKVGTVIRVPASALNPAAFAAGAAAAAAPPIEVDDADTEASKQRIRNLLDDIFKQ